MQSLGLPIPETIQQPTTPSAKAQKVPQLPKETQAAIKNLEAILAAYNMKMKFRKLTSPRPTTAPPDVRDKGIPLCHEAIIEYEEKHLCAVLQIFRSTNEEMEDVTASKMTSMIISRHGTLGWKKINPIDSGMIKGKIEFDIIKVEGLHDEVKNANDGAKFSKGNHSMIDFKDEEKQELQSKCDELQDFLIATVLPHIAEGMIHIARTNPPDPIRLLYEHLLKAGRDIEATAVERARNNFFNILAESEKRF